jgi:phosphatidylglycerol---prolipoprotein diacylglyceryl transferase
MFIHNINPTLLKLGFLEIRFYGIVYLLGFLLVYLALYKNKNKLKIEKEQIENLLLLGLIGMLVGARIFYFLFDNFYLLITKPFEILMVWHGGMSFFGALLGIFLSFYFYLKKINIDWKKVADVVVIPITIALILGRIANFINGELIGTASTLPWCTIFSKIDYICRHPYQIYASLSHLLLLFILIPINKIKERKDNLLFLTFLLGYSILRFLTDFFRQDQRFLFLTSWQYLSIVLAIISIYLLLKQRINKQQPTNKIQEEQNE